MSSIGRGLMTGAISAVLLGVALVVINARDQVQEPPTDTADVVATWAVVAGAAIRYTLRWGDTSKPVIKLIRAAAAGIAIGAVVVGLTSVVFDPWAS